jgi:hypothetical protein
MIIPKYNEPRIAGVVCFEFEWSVYAGGGSACGSSEGVRDIIIDIDECVRVGSDYGSINRGVGWRDVAKVEISVSMEESTFESFCEVVREIEFRVDAIKQHEVSVNPFADGEVFDNHMSSSRSGLLSIAHGGTSVVVFIENGSGLLRDPQVP